MKLTIENFARLAGVYGCPRRLEVSNKKYCGRILDFVCCGKTELLENSELFLLDPFLTHQIPRWRAVYKNGYKLEFTDIEYALDFYAPSR